MIQLTLFLLTMDESDPRVSILLSVVFVVSGNKVVLVADTKAQVWSITHVFWLAFSQMTHKMAPRPLKISLTGGSRLKESPGIASFPMRSR